MTRRKTGFTLVEMLVVLSIIALLVAIMMPTLSNVRTSARTALCATNLESLGQAYHTRTADLKFKNNGEATIPDPYTWPSLLEPYLADRSVVSCPADEELGELFGGEDPGSDTYTPTDFVEAPGYEYLHIHPELTFAIPMSDASFMVDTIPWSDPSKFTKRSTHYGSSPSPSLLFTVERPEYYLNATVRGMGWNTDADRDVTRREHQFSFVPQGEFVEGVAWKLYHYGQFQRYFTYNGTEITEQLDGNRTRIRSIPRTAWETASYGMNNRADALQQDNRVLLVDYPKIVADVAGTEANDVWSTQMNKVAPRHLGNVNVLRTDGSVNLRHPSQVDPGILNIHNNDWLPTRDEPLVP